MPIIEYSGYYRCEVMTCGSCKLARPLTEFYVTKSGKYASGCKACRKIKRKPTKASREAARVRNRANYAANRERHLSRMKTWRDAIGKEQLNHLSKLWRIQREEKLGCSISNIRRRHPLKRIHCMSFRIRRTYGIPITTKELREVLINSERYSFFWRQYKQSNYNDSFVPTLVPKRKELKPVTINDFKITTLRKARQLYAKKGNDQRSANRSAGSFNSSENGNTN